jgi:hypothetical protein
MDSISGGCQCGQLRFTVGLPSKWVAHCHCSMCRRAHGAGYVTWLGAEAAQAVIDDRAARLRWYASSAQGERGFCSHCGSTLFFRSSRWPGELHVVVANLDGPPDRKPQVHVSWDDRVDWASIDPADGLPRKGGVG